MQVALAPVEHEEGALKLVVAVGGARLLMWRAEVASEQALEKFYLCKMSAV